MAVPVSSQIFTPTLENFFGLNIGNEYATSDGGMFITRWTNPHLQQDSAFAIPTSAITPYIPGDSQQFAFTAPSEFWNQDITVIILSKLDLKNLVNCSTVCKSFYSASKVDFIWSSHLYNLLPNVTVVAPNLCIFTPEQQYKVIFKRIQNECKPYIAKFTYIQEVAQNWQNELKTLELQFQEAGGEEANQRYRQFMRQNANVPELFLTLQQNCPDYPAGQLKTKIETLQNRLSVFYGENYDGTIESIDPNSFQGQILKAINVLVPNAFDNQEMFESVIEKSAAIQNTSSSNSDGPTIEDVTDVADPAGS